MQVFLFSVPIEIQLDASHELGGRVRGADILMVLLLAFLPILDSVVVCTRVRDDDIVSFAVQQQLGEFAIQNVVFQQGVREDVELRDERYMQSFIKDAEQKGGEDQQVQQWVNDIRCSADEAVDIIDSFTLEIERAEAPKGRFMDCVRTCACICNKEAILYSIGKAIYLLREKGA
ncbi:hypothetical protein RJ640_017187 [Escallonia rubra]|uniref:Disease resistance N-terminal domain-containing protein n=1 Tax=Escallonia rubra TaxID=112253 RepID=A0AA88REG1_9ASTE|nr:hypothetical protein RJ640_017187 [Escallonia rubra]